MFKDLVSIRDLDLKEIQNIFDLAFKLKLDKRRYFSSLKGKTLALIFQKPSNRTRVSFEVGMYELGGNSIYLAPHEINLGVRESIKDVAKTLSRYVHGIVLRTFEHKNVLEMAEQAEIPVINGLSDFSHPCQALSDIFTLLEKFKRLKGKTLAYVGDANNVCNSLLFAASKLGLHMRVGSPLGYQPKEEVMREVYSFAQKSKAQIEIFSQAEEAVKGADVIYTDVWASMGQEAETQKRKIDFQGFQVNEKLVGLAKKQVLIMHCLPAHRGEEITDQVLDSPNSIVFDQAENRLHVQKAILLLLLGGKK